MSGHRVQQSGRHIATVAGAIGAGVGALGFGATLYSLFEARTPRVTTTDINLSDSHSATGTTFTVAQIADLHAHAGSQWLATWVQSALEEIRPDFVLNTGDNFSTSHGLQWLSRIFTDEAIRWRPGAFVFGSNDYYSAQMHFPGNYLLVHWLNTLGASKLADAMEPTIKMDKDLPFHALEALMENNGWVDLRNESAIIDVPMRRQASCCATVPTGQGRPQIRVALVGVDDPHIDRDRMPAIPDGWDKVDIKIGVTHAPYARVVDQMTRMGVDIIIAGHTHGGQIRIPGYGALVNNCDIPLQFSSGLHRWRVGTVAEPVARKHTGARDIHQPTVPAKDMSPASLPDDDKPAETWLYVSQGLGTNVYTPIRIACRPTLDVIRFHL